MSKDVIDAYFDIISNNPDARSKEIADKLAINKNEISSLNLLIKSNENMFRKFAAIHPRFINESCSFVTENAKEIRDFLLGTRIYPLIIELHPGAFCNFKCEFCLPGWTNILIEKKYTTFKEKKLSCKRIENIEIGDKVLSYNEKNGKKELDEVVTVFKRGVDELTTIYLNNGNEFDATDEHPVYVVDKGWTLVSDLSIGDRVLQHAYRGLKSRIKFLKYGSELANKKNSIYKSSNKGQNWKWKEGKSENWQSWNTGLTKETDKRIFDQGRKRSATYIKLYSEHPELIQKKMMNLGRKPSGPESKLVSVLNDKEWKYVGDGNFFIERFNPDFVNTNGKKKVIELNGCMMHCCKICGYEKNYLSGVEASYIHSRDEEKISTYKKYGFDTLTVWEHELKNLDSVKNKIEQFTFNPNVEIVEVINIEKTKYKTIVYNIETKKNHNFFANGILVHNCFSANDNYDEHIEHLDTIRPEVWDSICRDCKKNDVREIWFSGGKEPLTNKNTVHFIETANYYGFKTRLYTNGCLLNPSEPTLADCNQIRISVNAANYMTHMKVCGTNNDKLFSRLIGTISDLVDRKKESNGNFKAKIAVSFMIQRSNYNEIYAFFEKFLEIGVDSIQFRLDSIGRVPKLTPKERMEVIGQSTDIVDYMIKNKPVIDLSLRGITEDEFDRELLPGLDKPKVCMAGMIKRGINPWSIVYNCEFSSHPHFKGESKNLILGDVNKTSFGDIMKKSANKFPPVCKFCQAHEYGLNVLLPKLFDDLKFGINIEEQIFYKGK